MKAVGEYWKMRRTGYKQGYRIVINGNFFEVIDGKRVLHYGKCRRNITIQEIVIKTSLFTQEERNDVKYGNKRDIRKRI